MTGPAAKPTVAVVMCTYNGGKHIKAQLDSLVKQTWPIALFVFDDSSDDDTVEKIQAYAEQLAITMVVRDRNLGFVENFASGIQNVLAAGFHYIALSDQDDVWVESRIATGMHSLLSLEQTRTTDLPILLHCDLKMIDADERMVHRSFLTYRGYSIGKTRDLATVLGQNGVMGNTILMNSKLAHMALPFPAALHVHDYWLAVLAELYGHRELLDSALVNYRIHNDNASNSQHSVKFGLAKLVNGKSWDGLVRRDFRLPFKEDARLHTIEHLLDASNNLPALHAEQALLLKTFRDYLVFKQPRLRSLITMFKAGFFKPGIRHRLRLAFSILLTKRYP